MVGGACYTISVPGNPYPLKRPRRAKNGRMFDPAENVTAKRHIGSYARALFAVPIPGPVMVNIRFHIQRPKSHFGTRGLRIAAPVNHAQRPDVDNLIKAVFDALNGIAWVDDTQVIEVSARKDWCLDSPQTDIMITPCHEDAEGNP